MKLYLISRQNSLPKVSVKRNHRVIKFYGHFTRLQINLPFFISSPALKEIHFSFMQYEYIKSYIVFFHL